MVVSNALGEMVSSRMTIGFKGPLFLVGMPRSGTKMLRNMLNSHSKIKIPYIETELFPYWVRRWGSFGDLSQKKIFERFYEANLHLPYFIFCSLENKVIGIDRWYSLCKGFSPADVFEALIRHDVGAPFGSDVVWGDKSPSYINHIELLREHFPGCKIIHIVRDVRDYCISLNRAWGKNMIRAAQRWVDSIKHAMIAQARLGGDSLMLRYEDLLERPIDELKHVCEFLDIEFQERMLEFRVPSENLGDARETLGVLKDNKEKYKILMSERKRKDIELVCGSLLDELGYKVEFWRGKLRVNRSKMLLYRIFDGINIAKATLRRRGLRETAALMLGFLRMQA